MKLKTAWKWDEISRNVHVATFTARNIEHDGWVLLVSDVHWDNPKCDRKKLKRDFDEAVKRDALILSNGDFFCAMQGKYDRRSSKKDLRPEHQSNNYLDALVETGAGHKELIVDIVAPEPSLDITPTTSPAPQKTPNGVFGAGV